MILIIVWIGLIIALPLQVYRSVPVKRWREFLLPNLWWILLIFVKAAAWPGVLTHWMIGGMRPSLWRAIDTEDGREVRKITRVTPEQLAAR